jgi:hypothetical protein
MCGDMRFAEAVVADTATVEALALRAHVPDDEGVVLLVAVPPESLFLVQSVAP